MTRVNVVLPQAPGFNVGMAAVDLGLMAVAKELSLQITPWRVKALHELAKSRHPDLDARMDVGLGPTNLIDGSWPDGLREPILFWGDFHHMMQYVTAVGSAIGGDAGPACARRYLLLDGIDPLVVARSATFGTTLIFNSAADLLAPSYGQALRSFLRVNGAAWFRDPISVAVAARLRGREGVRLGVDPALFARQTLGGWTESEGGVGLFLGRSRQAHRGLLRVARTLAAHMNMPLEWIDWGDQSGFPSMEIPDGISVRGRLGSTNAVEALGHLASCRAVVTDSYHAALIAWSLGIPAVTITAPASNRPRSVDSGARWSWRDKRELAGSLYGALDLVIRHEELIAERMFQARMEHVLDVIEAGAVSALVKSEMETDASGALETMRAFMPRLVGTD